VPNPKIQVIVSDQLKERLEEEAEAQSKTLSSYCAELLGLLHTYPWVVIKAPQTLASKIKAAFK
jgi:hypothetical protein